MLTPETALAFVLGCLAGGAGMLVYLSPLGWRLWP